MQQGYYAVIPATVRYSRDVSDGAKLLYGEITALCDKSGFCWASNAYFADLYGVAKRTASRWISELSAAKFIATIADDEQANGRKIWLSEVISVPLKATTKMSTRILQLKRKKERKRRAKKIQTSKRKKRLSPRFRPPPFPRRPATACRPSRQ